MNRICLGRAPVRRGASARGPNHSRRALHKYAALPASYYRTVHVICPGELGQGDQNNARHVADVPLSATGEAQAVALSRWVATLDPPPQVVLVSPQTACLQTAVLAVHPAADKGDAPLVAIEAEPLLRARLTSCSRAGSHPAVLRAAFPRVYIRPMLPAWWEPEEAPSQPGAAGEGAGAGPEGADGAPALLNCCDGRDPSTPREPVAVESEGMFAHRMLTMRKALADRPERVLGVVADAEVVAALTGLELGPGEAGSRRMQLFCSRCRCGACWAPALD